MKIKGTYILREVAGSFAVVPVGATVADFNGMITLNETGAFLWQQLGEEIDRDGLIERLTAEYDVTPERAAADVDVFLHTLRENDFVTE